MFGHDEFEINKTNLFYVSEDDARNFKKIDGMLNGNTLYELFQNQVETQIVDDENIQYDSSESQMGYPDKELV